VRVTAAVLIGGLVCWLGFRVPPSTSSDFDQLHLAARAMLAGDDPYRAVRSSGAAFPLLYPLPAVLLVVPFGWLPVEAARIMWGALSAGALALAAEQYRRGLYVSLLSAPFLNALLLGQWSPLMTAAVVLPGLTVVWAAKPPIGVALFSAYPSRSAATGVGVMLLLSLALLPSWPALWLDALGATIAQVPILLPGGFLLLLPLLRWRRAEARLLVALACVPQTIGFYEMLPLFLLPRRRREAYVLAFLTYAASFVAMLGFPRMPNEPLEAVLLRRWPILLTLVYLPAVFLVLRQDWGDRSPVRPRPN
jgi:hypothetical protein